MRDRRWRRDRNLDYFDQMINICSAKSTVSLANDDYGAAFTYQLLADDLQRQKFDYLVSGFKSAGQTGGGGGGGLDLNFDSYWRSLPPEQFDRNLSVLTLSMSLFSFYLAHILHTCRDSQLFAHYGATSQNFAILLVVVFGLMCFFVGLWGLRELWRKKRCGEYASGAKNFFIKGKTEV